MKLISVKELVTLLVILAIVFAGMFVALQNFEGESLATEIELSLPSVKPENSLEMVIRLISIDPIKGDASARIEFIPHPPHANEAQELEHDIKVFLPTANGKTEFEFKKGKHMAPIDVSFSMYGNVASYPFDSHETLLVFYADAEGAQGFEPMPLSIVFTGSNPGYHLNVIKKESLEDWVQTSIEVSRSLAVTVFSCFVIVVMWALSISVLLMLITVLMRKQKIELGMFGFFSALLFAFYSLRNGQPNIPPIGVFSDFVGFFWAEIILTGCLLVGLLGWVFKSSKPTA